MSDGTDAAHEEPETAKWDPSFTRQVAGTVGPLIKRWHRAEVRNIESAALWRGRAGLSRR
jgi:hypothetical protein